MAGEIASAFVRIRPNMTGFKSEVEGGVKESVAGIGKIIGGALAAASAFEFGKKLIESAAEHQAAFAGLEKSTRNVGAATEVAGKSLESLLEKEATLKGFSDEQLAQAFLRLVTVTHSSAKAFTLLGTAEDLSRARNIDLETSALAVSKAIQGQTNSLQRYGIVVPRVKTAEDALSARRRAAVAEGAQFTAAQNAIYVSALKVAKAQDAQATKTESLRIVQQRFGGSAKTFADTASGQFARLQQDFHQFEAAIGTALLPGLASAAEGIGNFVGGLAHNEAFVQEIHRDVVGLGHAFSTVGSVLQALAPTFLTVASAAAHVAEAVGAPAILTAVAAYKGLTIASTAAYAAEQFYARAVAASVPAIEAATAANAELAASETAAGAAGGGAAAGGLRNFIRGVGALGLAGGGPTVVATAGLAVLAGAFVYLATRTSDAAKAMQAFRQGIGPLGQALQDLPADRLAVSQAKLNLRVADHALAISKAKPGSVEMTQLLLNQKNAVLELAAAQHRLTTETKAVSTVSAANAAALIARARGEAGSREANVRGRFANELSAGLGDDPAVKLKMQAYRAELAAGALRDLTKALRGEADAQRADHPLVAHNIELLAAYATQIKRIPARHTTEFILHNQNAKLSVGEIVAALKKADSAVRQAGLHAGATFALGFVEKVVQGFLPLSSPTSDVWASIAKGAAGAASEAAAAVSASTPEVVKAARHRQTAAEQAIKALRQGVSLDQATLADLKQQAELQVQSGIEAISSAITQAKGSFNAIGQTIAQDIAATLEQPFVVAQQQLNDEVDRAALQFDIQSAKFQARATVFDQALQAIQFRQQARAAQFAGKTALLDQQSNRAALRSDQINLAQLRRSVILPGGKTLSTNNQEALGQLEAFARRSTGASRLAIQAFIVQYQQAIGAVERDKIGIATTPNPKQAQRAADLSVAQSRNQIQTAVAAAKHAAAQAQQQIRADIIRIGADVAAARARIAAREIADLTDAFNRAPTAANLKRVTKKIADLMARDHVSFRTAGAQLGTAFMHGFQAQFTGLGLQGQALVGVKGAAGGGLVPGVTKPLETIAQQALQQAQIAKQQRATQIDLGRKQETLLRKIHASQAADKFIKSIQKNPGQASRNARDLAR